MVSKIAELQGEHLRAIQILALMENHPGTLPVDMQQAQVALTHLRTLLPDVEFSTAYERGKTLHLEVVVTEFLHHA